jgi:hypothetical protein
MKTVRVFPVKAKTTSVNAATEYNKVFTSGWEMNNQRQVELRAAGVADGGSDAGELNVGDIDRHNVVCAGNFNVVFFNASRPLCPPLIRAAKQAVVTADGELRLRFRIKTGMHTGEVLGITVSRDNEAVAEGRIVLRPKLTTPKRGYESGRRRAAAQPRASRAPQAQPLSLIASVPAALPLASAALPLAIAPAVLALPQAAHASAALPVITQTDLLLSWMTDLE